MRLTSRAFLTLAFGRWPASAWSNGCRGCPWTHASGPGLGTTCRLREQLIDQQHIEYEVTNGLNRPLSFRLACLSCDWVA